MPNCIFVNKLPDYFLDRTIIINNNHEHRISGYKLAKASNYFKCLLFKLRQLELENYYAKENAKNSEINTKSKRHRARSVCSIDLKPLVINYHDLHGIECLLTFIHCNDLNQLQFEINPNKILSMLKAGIYFQVKDFLEFCINLIKADLNNENCWLYWKISDKLVTDLSELNNFIYNYVLTNFIVASHSKQFLTLEEDDFQKFLKDDALNCSDEKILFNLIEKWINHDYDKRQYLVPEVLKCLRLGRLMLSDLETLSTAYIIQSCWNLCSPIIKISRLLINEISLKRTSGNPLPALKSGEEYELSKYLKKPRLPHSAIFVIGGWEGNQYDPNFGPSKDIQVYDSRADIWYRLSNNSLCLDDGHSYSGCVIYKTKIYVVGGYVTNGPTQTLKALDLTCYTWKTLSPMYEKRNYVCTCILENVIYAIGGHNGKNRLNSAEKYDIDRNHWTIISPMIQVRSDAGAASLNGLIFVVGGFDGHHFYDSVESYDPRVDQWTLMSSMLNIRSGVSVTVLDGYLYAIGGNDGLQRLRTMERYNPETNQWQIMPSMINQRSNFCVAVLENMIYVMGGWSDETNSTIQLVERWNPNTSNQWESVNELSSPASANCCCCVSGIESIKKALQLLESANMDGENVDYLD